MILTPSIPIFLSVLPSVTSLIANSSSASPIALGVNMDMQSLKLFEPDIEDAVKVLTTGFFGTGSSDALSGLYRLPNNNSIGWRNFANNADILLTLNTSDVFQLGASTNITGTFTADTYVGQSSIVTLGTITTGVWNGTVIDQAFLDTNIVLNNQGNVYTGGGTQDFGGADLTDIGDLLQQNSTTSILISRLFRNQVVANGTTISQLQFRGSSDFPLTRTYAQIETDNENNGF